MKVLFVFIVLYFCFCFIYGCHTSTQVPSIVQNTLYFTIIKALVCLLKCLTYQLLAEFWTTSYKRYWYQRYRFSLSMWDCFSSCKMLLLCLSVKKLRINLQQYTDHSCKWSLMAAFSFNFLCYSISQVFRLVFCFVY